MIEVKHALQRDVFTPCKERLLGVVHVGKVGGKRKKTFLCASVTTERPVEVFLSKIKKQEKGDSYKKQKVWQLREIRIVNGKSDDTTEFELQFDKSARWSASSVAEKNDFLSCLWKLCHRYLPRQHKPSFLNIPDEIREVSVSGLETIQDFTNVAGTDEDALTEYQALTNQEEIDLGRMMTECEYAISDVELFTKSLSKDLSVLDGQNMHSILGSEAQVNSLMLLLDNALNEVSKIENRLDNYDNMVGNISSQMGQMKNQESFIQITNKNHQQLLEDLDKLVMQLDLSKGHIKALKEANLNQESGIEACTSAADALQQAMKVELPQGLSQLQAVSDQQKLFHQLLVMFAKRLYDQLVSVFVRQGKEDHSAPLAKKSSSLRLPKHFPFHRDLLPYKQLILWLKEADKTKYTQLCTVYTQNLNQLYSQEISDFMASAKQRFAKQELSSSIKNLSTSQQSLTKEKKKLFGSTQSLAIKSVGKKIRLGHKKGINASRESLAASDFELCDREKFSSTFQEVLNELEPTCQDEERFIMKFFHLNVESSDTMLPGGSDDEDNGSEKALAHKKKYQEAHVTKEIRHSFLSSVINTVCLRQVSQGPHLSRMMNELFSIVESELSKLISFGEELDQLNSLNMLVLIGQRVAKAQQENDGSFLTKMLGNCLIEVKRSFDNLMRSKVDAVEDAHLGKNKKCGILHFVQEFEDFVELAESIFRDCERRTDIDKAYKTLIRAVFEAIQRVAAESHKIPAEVIMFENYHHLLNCLKSLKVASLEQEKNDVKSRYNLYLDTYVTNMLGRPLEKLSNFFEGVERLIESGVRPEEVGFQLKFSKQELRRAIKEYTGKDVKKGLETLYHKIVKHTAENGNRLLQVVWQHMQEEFIRQYKRFDGLISKCYPDSDIKLEFNIEHVLRYFSDIALF